MTYSDALIAAQAVKGAVLIRRRFGLRGLRYIAVVLVALSGISIVGAIQVYSSNSATVVEYRSVALLFAMLSGMCIGGMMYATSSQTRAIGISFNDADALLRVHAKPTTASLMRSLFVVRVLQRCGISQKEISRFRSLRREKLALDTDTLNVDDVLQAIIESSPSIRTALAALGDSCLARSLAWSRRVERLHLESERWWSPDRLKKVPSLGMQFDIPLLPTTRRHGHDVRDECGYAAIIARRPLYSSAVRSIERALAKKSSRNALVVADDHRAAVDAVLAFSHAVAEGSVEHSLEGMETYFVGDDTCHVDEKDVDVCTQRLVHIIEEAAHVGGAILVVRRLDALLEAMHARGSNAIDCISKALQTHKVPVIAITDSKGYHRTLVTNREVTEAFEFVRVDVDTDEDARVFLEDAISLAERRSKAVVTVDAIDEALAIARRTRPGFSPSFAALDVVDDVIDGIKDEESVLVDGAAIRRYLGEVEVPDVSSSTEVELNQVEQVFLSRVIGQEDAVSRVVATLRASFAGLRRDDRPIACMLFVGPTGSGKGELITAIAQQLIGDESVVELSGGDYADEAAGERLEASLTAALEKKQCVIAIEDVDSISSGARGALERLMAGTLSALHARDSVIIASTSIAAEQAARSAGIAEITEVLRHNGVPKEFIDRFDALVPFRALSREAFRSVVIRALHRAADSMRERGILLEVTPSLVDVLAVSLYDERFGASEVDRIALQTVEDPVARALLAGTIRKGQTVELLPKDTENPSGGLIAKVR